jgi:hypothetical protein
MMANPVMETGTAMAIVIFVLRPPPLRILAGGVVGVAGNSGLSVVTEASKDVSVSSDEVTNVVLVFGESGRVVVSWSVDGRIVIGEGKPGAAMPGGQGVVTPLNDRT